MDIILIGHGRMGRLLEETALANGDRIAGIFDADNIEELATFIGHADVMIDFSRPESLAAVESYVQRTGCALVSGTTGYSPEEKARVEALGAFAPVVWSANYSLGIAVLGKALSLVAPVLRAAGFDTELTETHHNLKVDAPSGTAKLLIERLDPDHELTPVYGREGITGERTKNEIGVHALRGGTVAGTHTVHFFGTDEELEFTHRATSRKIFVNGALEAARRLAGQDKGWKTLDALLFS